MEHPEVRKSSPSILGWVMGMLMLLLALGFMFWLIDRPMPPESGMGAPPVQVEQDAAEDRDVPDERVNDLEHDRQNERR